MRPGIFFHGPADIVFEEVYAEGLENGFLDKRILKKGRERISVGLL